MLKIPKPTQTTLKCGLAALVTVLLMSWVRPLGVLFLAVLSYWLYWTRCSFRIVLTPELRQKFDAYMERATNWRHKSPAMFCAVSSACLATIAILGHFISGSTLVLTVLVLSALISTKYNFKLLKIEPRDFQWSERINYNNIETEVDEEFLPEVNESNLFVLQRASDMASISSPTDADADDEDEGSDKIPSDLLIPDSIPEIDENSTDEDDELLPFVRNKQQQQQKSNDGQQQQKQANPKTMNDTQRGVEEEEAETKAMSEIAIEFRRGHFKRDSMLSSSSSSSEESLSKGLQFPDHTSVDGRQPNHHHNHHQHQPSSSTSQQAGSEMLALSFAAHAQTLLPNLVANFVQWGVSGGGGGGGVGSDIADSAKTIATTTTTAAAAVTAQQQQQDRRVVTALDSSDESDFEILETDDIK